MKISLEKCQIKVILYLESQNYRILKSEKCTSFGIFFGWFPVHTTLLLLSVE